MAAPSDFFNRLVFGLDLAGGDAQWVNLWRMIDTYNGIVPDSIGSADLSITGTHATDWDGVDLQSATSAISCSSSELAVDTETGTSDAYTIIVSCTPDDYGHSSNNFGRIVALGEENAAIECYFSSADTDLKYRSSPNSTTVRVVGTTGLSLPQLVEIAYVHPTTGDDSLIVFLDGSHNVTVTGYALAESDAATTTFLIGNRSGLDRGFDGTFHWAGIIDRDLSVGELTDILSRGRPNEIKPAFPIGIPTASTPSITYGGDFLSKLVLTPSLTKGQWNFANNEPVVFDPEHPLARGLIRWLPFNEGYGNTLRDPASQVGDAVVSGTGSVWGTNERGNYLDIPDGTTDYVTAGNFSGLSDRTISGWFYLFVENDVALFSNFDNSTIGCFALFFDNTVATTSNTDVISYIVRVNSYLSDWIWLESSQITTPGWYHIAVTHDMGTTANIYINGIEDTNSSQNLTDDSSSPAVSCSIGRSTDWHHDDLKAADVRLYDRALSAEEIFQIYSGDLPLKPAIPLGIPTPTGGDESGTLTAGQLVLEGNAPSGLVSRVGSLALAGALVLQGAAPTALVSEQGTITAGQLVLEGSAPTAQISTAGTLTAGQLVLEGNAPTGEITGVGAIVAGQLALEGNSPTATQTYIGTIVGGELVLEGQAPVGTQTSIGTLVAGQLVLEGNAPTALEGNAGVIVAGELVLEGNSPTAIFAQIGTLTAGQLVLDGNAPTGDIGNQLGTIVAGSLVLQGYAPNDGSALAGKFGAVLSGLTFGIDNSTTKYGITTTYSSGSTS